MNAKPSIWSSLAAPGVFLVTAATLVLFAVSSVHGLWRADAFDYAQIARELTEGNGFTSRQAIYVLHLRFLDNHQLIEEAWPNLHRFPLPSICMAVLFFFFGASDAVVVAYGILFNAATSVILWFWARHAFGVLPALGVVALFTFNPVFLENGCSGLAEPPVVFFFTLALYWIFRCLRGDPSRRSIILAGVFLGIAALGRTNILFSLPIFVAAIVFAVRKVRAGAASEELVRFDPSLSWVRGTLYFVSSFVLVVSPWCVRNLIVAGSPFFSLHSYFLLPASKLPLGNKWDSSLYWVRNFVSPLRYAMENPGVVWEKWMTNVGALVQDFPFLGMTWGIPVIALLGIFISTGRATRVFAALLFSCFVVNAGLVSCSDTYFDKYHYQFLPAIMLVAMGVIFRMLQKIGNEKIRGPIFFLLVAVLANIPRIFDAHKSTAQAGKRYRAPHMRFVEENTSPDGIIFSDQSFAITWLTGRRSVRNHLDRNMNGLPVLSTLFFEKEFGLSLDGIYLSRQCLAKEEWREALGNSLKDDRFVARFPRRKRFENGALFLYRDPVSDSPQIQ